MQIEYIGNRYADRVFLAIVHRCTLGDA